jgi:uncharacterized flavoprotein (TIGR03862 family)
MPPKAAVIGAGPAGLMAAERLSAAGCAVTVYDRMPSVGRKFLMAGRGGLNLTHSETLVPFLLRYRDGVAHVADAIEAFPPQALRDWADGLGGETFIGSSGRVFPRALKASPLLRAWLSRLAGQGVVFCIRHDWRGWDGDGGLVFETPQGPVTVCADATILAMGGASWPRLGADGAWGKILAAQGIAISPLRPANCGFATVWSAFFRDRFEGQPLKNVGLNFEALSARGDLVVTAYGIEGGAIYALSAALREAIAATGEAVLRIDLRPDMTEAVLVDRLQKIRGRESVSNALRKAVSLSPVAIGLLREAVGITLPRHPGALAAWVKSVPVKLTGPQSLARAISTAGGVGFSELDRHFMLRRRPGVFAAGEMLDWEAPTGGYLLQACFATGAAAAAGALGWLASDTAAG